MFTNAMGPPNDFNGDISIHLVSESFVGSMTDFIIGTTSGMTDNSVL